MSPREAGLRQVHTEYRSRASRDGLLWDLTTEQFVLLATGSCTYCGSGPRRVVVPPTYRLAFYKGVLSEDELFVTNGIDRRDSSLGYTKENSTSCCTMCNLMKRDMLPEDFLAHVERIYRHQQSKTE